MNTTLNSVFALCLAQNVLSAGCAVSSGPVSSHFDGGRFFNPEGGNHSFGDGVKWLWEMETVDWPEWIDDPPRPPPVARVAAEALRVTYVNHSTVLLQIDGFNILTDPIWSKRAGPTSWLGVKRVRAPGVKLDRLPPIDIVLISHDHYDHLDLPTIKALARRDRPRFFTGLGVGRCLCSVGVPAADIVELDWWQEYVPPGAPIRIVYVPARHSSGRAPFSEDRTLWGGFVIDAPAGQVYFAGDTGFGRFVYEIAARFPRVRLAILPIGSYEKRWFMKAQHMNPDDEVVRPVAGRFGRWRSAGPCALLRAWAFTTAPLQSIQSRPSTHTKRTSPQRSSVRGSRGIGSGFLASARAGMSRRGRVLRHSGARTHDPRHTPSLPRHPLGRDIAYESDPGRRAPCLES